MKMRCLTWLVGIIHHLSFRNYFSLGNYQQGFYSRISSHKKDWKMCFCIASRLWPRLSERPSISMFPNLTQLFLYKTFNGYELIFRTGWFIKSKTLYYPRDLTNLKRVEIKEAMPNLEKFFFVSLYNMPEVPIGIWSLKPIEQLLFGWTIIVWRYHYKFLNNIAGMH